MAYCLPKHLVNGFLKKLKSGEINPDTLLDMTSQQRRDFFSEFLGAENAKEVNTLLESKLILKNQQQGIINWAKQVAHLKPDAQKDLLSRINKMTEILEPEEEDAFLEDLVAKKLEVYITSEEASGIAELARIATIKKAKMETNEPEVRMLESRSYAFKLLANSFYGYLGFSGARWYCFPCAQATTAYARNYIQETIRKAEEAGFSVCYSDTDSCFLLLGKKSKEEIITFINSYLYVDENAAESIYYYFYEQYHFSKINKTKREYISGLRSNKN